MPIAIVAILGASVFLRNDRGSAGVRFDLPGVLLGSGGLLALVGGFTEAESRGWRDGYVLALLIGGLVLLGVFALVQRKVRNPLLPMRIIADRNRAGALISIMMATYCMFSTFLFLSYYLQGNLHYSPIMAGLTFLPVTTAIAVGAMQIASRLLTKVSARVVLMPAFVFAAGGELWFTQLPPSGGYGLHVVPGLILFGLGLGGVMMTSMSTATADVRQKDIGVTSAAANTAQQIGGSLGVALLNTIAASATAGYISTHSHSLANIARATVHGYTTAFWVSVGVLLLAGVIGGAMIHSNLQGSNS